MRDPGDSSDKEKLPEPPDVRLSVSCGFVMGGGPRSCLEEDPPLPGVLLWSWVGGLTGVVKLALGDGVLLLLERVLRFPVGVWNDCGCDVDGVVGGGCAAWRLLRGVTGILM